MDPTHPQAGIFGMNVHPAPFPPAPPPLVDPHAHPMFGNVPIAPTYGHLPFQWDQLQQMAELKRLKHIELTHTTGLKMTFRGHKYYDYSNIDPPGPSMVHLGPPPPPAPAPAAPPPPYYAPPPPPPPPPPYYGPPPHYISPFSDDNPNSCVIS